MTGDFPADLVVGIELVVIQAFFLYLFAKRGFQLVAQILIQIIGVQGDGGGQLFLSGGCFFLPKNFIPARPVIIGGNG